MMNALARKMLAELIGTFGLVTAGCGAIIANHNGALPSIGVAFTFGLVIAVMVSSIGHIRAVILTRQSVSGSGFVAIYPSKICSATWSLK